MSQEFMTKLQYAGLSSCLFLMMSLPQMYVNTNDYLQEQSTCPTYKSKLLHFIIFAVLTYLSVKYLAKSDKPTHELLEYSIKVSLLYFFMSSVEMYQLTNIICSAVQDSSITTLENSCPTLHGTLIHTLLFGVSLVFIDYVK